MSTKIYSGYRLPVMSMQELLTFCQSVRRKIKTGIREEFAKKIAGVCVSIVDAKAMNIPIGLYEQENFKVDEKDSIIVNAKRYLDERIRASKKSPYRDVALDFGFSFTVHPLDDKILCIVYSGQQALTKVWESFPEVQDYHYQNQTDQPEEISDKEWEQRSKDWTIALPDEFSSIPSLSGFTVECSVDWYCGMWYENENNEIMKHIWSYETRVNNIVDFMIRKEFMDNYKETNKITDESEYKWIYRADDQMRQERKTEEWKTKEQTVKEFVESKLPKVITLEMLMEKKNG